MILSVRPLAGDFVSALGKSDDQALASSRAAGKQNKEITDAQRNQKMPSRKYLNNQRKRLHES